MKLLIVESLGFASHVKNKVTQHCPDKFEDIIETDSFDHALTILPREGDVCVVASWEFHDKSSRHRNTVPQTLPDREKNGDILACAMKELNPNVRFISYSKSVPQTKFVDHYVSKGKEEWSEEMKSLLKILKRI